MKIIDNFLPEDQFGNLQSFLMGSYFPWYYNDYIVDFQKDDQTQFTNTLYHPHPPWNGKTTHYFVVEPIISKLGVTNLYRVKANLRSKTFFPRSSAWHLDDKYALPATTSIFYINTNNGYTKFKKGGRVKSVANRMVIFDSTEYHCGVSCTDQKSRVLINFNYS